MTHLFTSRQALPVVLTACLLYSPFITDVSDALCDLLPANYLSFPVGLNTGLSEAEYNQVLDEVDATFGSEVANHGGKLMIGRRQWDKPEVNAHAFRKGHRWHIEVDGGTARFPSMTMDGLRLVVCHELGHHLGGYPQYDDNTKMSIEGQADYYATLKCMRKLFSGDDNVAAVSRMTVHPLVREKCEMQFTTDQTRALCIRNAMASEVLAIVLHESTHEHTLKPSFETPVARVVSSIFEGHSNSQCRLDTFFNGSLCGVDANEDMNSAQPEPGTCSEERGDVHGVRPRCWYKPLKPTSHRIIAALR